jgi:hypothetical protein
MPQVGFKPTIPVFERAKTVLALHRAAAVIGTTLSESCKIFGSKGPDRYPPGTERKMESYTDNKDGVSTAGSSESILFEILATIVRRLFLS